MTTMRMSAVTKIKREWAILATIFLVGIIVLYDGDESPSHDGYWDPKDVELRVLTASDATASDENDQLSGANIYGPDVTTWSFEEGNGESNHFYLEGIHELAGLGHSFMAFNNLVTLARQNNLMPRFYFQTSGHDLHVENVKQYFFGDAFMSPLPTGMECAKITCSPESLPQLISDAKNNGDQCKIFSLQGKVGPSKAGSSVGSNIPLLRQRFMERKAYPPQSSDDITIAVHIRRGDLFSFLGRKYQDQAAMRLVTASAYVSVLQQLFSRLESQGKRNIKVDLYCEGMKPPASVETVHQTYLDIRKELSYDSTILNVSFAPGAKSTLQAFDSMCQSDIIITGTSGMSYAASILCSKPVILAFPFWLPYRDIPNAIQLEVEKATYTLPRLKIRTPVSLVSQATFDESKFDSLFTTISLPEVD